MSLFLSGKFRPFFVYSTANFKGEGDGIPAFFAYFGLQNFPAAPNQHRSFVTCFGKPGNTVPSPLPGALPHIHSKTACRGFKSFCPCQKSQVSLVRYLTFSLVCGRIWQRGAPAGPPAVRVVGRWSPVATVQRRPRRQPRQVLLPLPQNRRKHWVFAGFLFSCVAWFWGSFWFGLRVFAPGFIRSQPLPPAPAPKTHPVSPFSGFSGCVSLFLPSFDLQNFRLCFCASCRIAFTD